MKIAEYKQINTKIEEYTITIPTDYDEKGNVVSEEHEEIRTRTIPVMGMVYRDATPEEVAEMERMNAEIQTDEPSQLDRIEAQAMYTALMTDTLIEEE